MQAWRLGVHLCAGFSHNGGFQFPTSVATTTQTTKTTQLRTQHARDDEHGVDKWCLEILEQQRSRAVYFLHCFPSNELRVLVEDPSLLRKSFAKQNVAGQRGKRS